MNYKGILLDLDDTLYNYDIAHEEGTYAVLSYTSNLLNKSKNEIEYMLLQAKKSVKKDLSGTAASHNRLLYFQRMLEGFNVNAQLHALKIYEIYWVTFLNSMQLYPGVNEFIEFSKGIPICLVTDLTAHIQHRKLDKLGLCQHINFMVSSEEAGREKPDPYIFLLALDKLKLRKNEVIMIGDNFNKDIIGASSIGINSFWINHKRKEPPIVNNKIKEVSDFLQLREMLSYVHS